MDMDTIGYLQCSISNIPKGGIYLDSMEFGGEEVQNQETCRIRQCLAGAVVFYSIFGHLKIPNAKSFDSIHSIESS